jgi:mono/diheme cytochrome c family protein
MQEFTHRGDAGRKKPTIDVEDVVFRVSFRLACLTALAAALSLLPAVADDAEVERGKYLVTISGCNDCHTPGYFFGKPDMSRFLGGSDVGFEIPGLGVFVGPNITPDKETGIGSWTAEQIVTAIQTGCARTAAHWRRSCLGTLLRI